MGWTFTQGQTKADLVEELTRSWGEDGNVNRHIRHALVGSHLWQVREWNGELFIMLSLIEAHRGYGYGHKDMDEAMGPSYFDCPLYFLDAVPQPESPYSDGWRANVRAHHAEKAKTKALVASLKVGDVIKLKHFCSIPWATITRIEKRRIIAVYEHDRYRIPQAYIEDILPSIPEVANA